MVRTIFCRRLISYSILYDPKDRAGDLKMIGFLDFNVTISRIRRWCGNITTYENKPVIEKMDLSQLSAEFPKLTGKVSAKVGLF
jgi:hypothetical protein